MPCQLSDLCTQGSEGWGKHCYSDPALGHCNEGPGEATILSPR